MQRVTSQIDMNTGLIFFFLLQRLTFTIRSKKRTFTYHKLFKKITNSWLLMYTEAFTCEQFECTTNDLYGAKLIIIYCSRLSCRTCWTRRKWRRCVRVRENDFAVAVDCTNARRRPENWLKISRVSPFFYARIVKNWFGLLDDCRRYILYYI